MGAPPSVPPGALPDPAPRRSRPLARIDFLSLGVAALALLIRLPHLRWGLPEVEEEAVPVRKAFEMWGWNQDHLTLDPQTAGWPHLSFHVHLAWQHLQYAIGKWTGRYADRLDFYVEHADVHTLMVPARLLSVLVGVAVVVVGVRLARRLAGRSGALLAGLVLAASPLLFEHSIKVTPDAFLTLFSALALSRLLDIYEKGRLRDYVWAAVWIGLGAASKYTPLLLVPCLVGVHLARCRGEGVWRCLLDRRLLGAGVALIVTFFVASPFTILNVAVAKRDISSQFAHVTGGHFGYQLRGSGYLFYLTKTLPAALGWPAVILGIAGLVFGGLRRGGTWTIVLASFACYYGGLGVLRSLYPHYMLPALLPVVLGLAGLVQRVEGATRTGRRPGPLALVTALFAVVLIPLAVSSVREQRRYARPSTAREAKGFILEELVRPDTYFACEIGGPALPRDPVLEYSRQPIFQRLDEARRERLLRRPFVNQWIIPLYMASANGSDLYYDLRHYLDYDYIVVTGAARGRYTRLPDLFPRQTVFYADLERYCRLVRYVEASPERLGPDVWIYAVDAGSRRILSDRGHLAPGFHAAHMEEIRIDALQSFLANVGLLAKHREDWRAADLYLSTLLDVTPPRERSLPKLVDLAEVKHRAGNRAEAERLSGALLQAFPDDPRVRALHEAIVRDAAGAGEPGTAANEG